MSKICFSKFNSECPANTVSDAIAKAYSFMVEKHKGQVRKGTTTPYIVHTKEAGEIASQMTDDENIIIAALLHDTIEDAGVSRETLEDNFGKRAADIVASESETKKDSQGSERPWETRKQETINEICSCTDEGVLIVCLADKLSNMRAISRDYKMIGDKLWDRFNADSSAKQGWYYSKITEALGKTLSTYPEWRELNSLVQEVFPGN